MIGLPRVSPRNALERMQRTTYFAIGLAAALFTALLAGGPNGFLAQVDQLRAPFGIVTVIIGVAIPASFSVLAFVLPLRAMRAVITATAAGFVACQLLWVPMMLDDSLADGAAPWLQGFGALHAILLAVAWRSPAIWAFPVAQWPIVAVVEYFAAGGDLEQSFLDGVGALVTCLIITGAGAGVVAAAAAQDVEAERAAAEASLEASLRTAEREQARINAVVHDDIMSVLLAASRTPTPVGVVDQAQRALRSVATIRAGSTREHDYTAQEVAAVLRATASEISADVKWTASISGTALVPATVVAALAEATGEALRNSVNHAGQRDAAVRRTVDLAAEDGRVRVTVSDDGRGFNPRAVPQRRLGLAVSIHGRMNALPGGGARVRSAPGSGTTVDLWWHAEGTR